MKKKEKFIFIIYLVFLFLFVIVKFKGSFYGIYDRIQSIQWNREQGNWNYNFDFFKTIKQQFSHIHSIWAIINLLGNVIAFIPLGYFIKVIYCSKKKLLYFLFLCITSIIAIEIFQFLTLVGSFDVDDIFLNTIGCLIGYLLYNISLYFKTRK